MKPFVRSILISSILSITASSIMVAQTSNSQFEQWYRAKYGRPSRTEQARLNTPQPTANAAEATQVPASVSAQAGFEQWYLVKYGRPSPTQEVRLQSPQTTPASPQAAQPLVAVAVSDQGTSAKTPAEHERIAQSYRDQAQNYLAQAKEHEVMIAAYKASPNMTSKNQAATINHCEYFAAKFKDMAAKSQELAELHEEMAKQAGQK
jgi:hypothetical protein